MPDLGRYALEVTLAYAVSLVLLGGIVLLSVVRSRRVRRALERAETEFAARAARGSKAGRPDAP